MKLLTKGKNVATFVLDLTGVTLVNVDPALTINSTEMGSQTTLSIDGGLDKQTYTFDIETPTATYNYAVWVDYFGSPDNAQQAFERLVGQLDAGGSAIGQSNFVVDSTADLSDARVSWQLIDTAGRVWSSGNSFDLAINTTSFGTTIKAQSVVYCPTEVPPTTFDTSYQVVWTLQYSNVSQKSAEVVSIIGTTEFPLGTSDAVEMLGDNATCTIVLPAKFSSVNAQLYFGNTLQTVVPNVTEPIQTSSGFLYSASFDTSTLTASLDPYTISWSYEQQGVKYREISRVWLATPSIIQAIPEVQAMVMKARTTINGASDTLFEPATVLTWLQQGRDLFNGFGANTWFDMTNATSAIRVFWLRATEILALRAQALAEGEKAFNFQGQSISLEVDRSAVYNQLADTLQSAFDNDVKPFKQQLATRNLIQGDGDFMAINRRPPMAAVGVTRTPLNYYYGFVRGSLWRP